MSNEITGAITPDSLPTDPADVEQDAQAFFDRDIDTLVQSMIILGQLDPTEINLQTGLPRWTPEQMKVISGARSQLATWQE